MARMRVIWHCELFDATAVVGGGLFWYIGRLYKKTPRFGDIPSLVGQLLVNAISINSGYTSRIVVSNVNVNVNQIF